MTPKELENVMVAKQAAQSLMNQWDTISEYLNVMAKARRQYYEACIREGFSAPEALHLAAVFQFPAAGPDDNAG